MHIELLEQSEADVIAREDASDGEFFRRADGSVWYRNIDAPEPMPVAPDEATFRSAVAALNCYSLAVVRVDPNDDDGQMVLVRQLA